MKKDVLPLLLSTLLFFFSGLGLGAQERELQPWVLVVPPANETGNTTLDPIGTTIAETIRFNLGLLGDFEVRELPPERISEAVIEGEEQALATLAESATMDYIVHGSVREQGDSIVIAASVYERASEQITVTESRTAESLLDTFEAADELAVSFLTVFSGQRIAFGTVILENTGWSEGSYRVLVDGQQIAVDSRRVNSVLIGEREIAVVANNGADPGAVVLRQEVTITEDEPTTISFAIAEPVEEEPEETQEPEPAVAEVPETAVAEEPEPAVAEEPETEAEPEPQIEVSPRPWSRNTRTVAGRRPIFTFGLHGDANLRTRQGQVLETLSPFGLPAMPISGAWIGMDLPRRIYVEIGFSLIGNPAEGNVEDKTAVRNYVEGGNEVREAVTARYPVSLRIGPRLLERDWGSVRADVVPYGLLGYTLSNTFFLSGEQATVEDSSGNLVTIDERNSLDPTDDSFDGQRYVTTGAGVTGRVHWRRASLRLGGWIARDTRLPGDESILDGDSFTAEDSAGNSYEFRITDKLSESAWVFGFDIGLSLSWGGRRRNP